MNQLQKTFHADGSLAGEIPLLNGKRHGVARAWSPTGELTAEVTFVNGEQLGRCVVFDAHGRPETTVYFLERGIVSRAAYNRACKVRPELPRYPNEEPAGSGNSANELQTRMAPPQREAFDGVSDGSGSDSTEHRFFVDLMSQRNAEARAWLDAGTQDQPRTLGELVPSQARQIVRTLYKLGASEVLAVQILDSDSRFGEETEHVVVRLPRDPGLRAKLFAFERRRASANGFDGEQDSGQELLYFKF